LEDIMMILEKDGKVGQHTFLRAAERTRPIRPAQPAAPSLLARLCCIIRDHLIAVGSGCNIVFD
jgi:hypothetical protein